MQQALTEPEHLPTDDAARQTASYRKKVAGPEGPAKSIREAKRLGEERAG
jgi:hypothetical protein